MPIDYGSALTEHLSIVGGMDVLMAKAKLVSDSIQAVVDFESQWPDEGFQKIRTIELADFKKALSHALAVVGVLQVLMER